MNKQTNKNKPTNKQNKINTITKERKRRRKKKQKTKTKNLGRVKQKVSCPNKVCNKIRITCNIDSTFHNSSWTSHNFFIMIFEADHY